MTKLYAFHLMPYADLDLKVAAESKTTWVTFSNSNHDPAKVAKLYDRYLGELVYAEELGFDGALVNEHQQTAYGLMPSPIVMASILARTTKRMKIGILGSAIPLRQHPLTLAEEHAMIDILSGGRLISGFVRGIGAEYHSFGVNPTESHDRFHEAHDLITQAWSRPGPFAFEGKYYNHRYVNLWPQPLQRPHPPIWIPSQGSAETIEWAAHPDRKYTFLMTFSPVALVEKFLQQYRDQANKYGYEATDDQVGWACPVFVGETDEEAIRLARPHFENFRNLINKMTMEQLLPPGYSSRASMMRIAEAKKNVSAGTTIEEAMEVGTIVCGSPKTVADTFLHYKKRMGFEHLLLLFQFGTLNEEMTRANMKLFAEQVAPVLRQAGSLSAAAE